MPIIQPAGSAPAGAQVSQDKATAKPVGEKKCARSQLPAPGARLGRAGQYLDAMMTRSANKLAASVNEGFAWDRYFLERAA